MEYSLKEEPDLFLMAGDIFDKKSPSNESRVFLIREVRKLSEAGINVVAIGGNHDMPRTPGATSMAIDALSGAGLATVFSSTEVQSEAFRFDGKSVVVSGRSYLTQSENQNPMRGVTVDKGADYNIFMVHGSLQGLGVRPNTPEMAAQNPFYAQDIPDGVDYLAMGHFHNSFERAHGRCRIVNPGSVERLDWSEFDDKKAFAWVDMNESGADVDFIPLEMRPMESSSLSLNRNAGDLTKVVREHLAQSRDPEKLFRLGLEGSLNKDEFSKLNFGDLLNYARDAFFDFDLVRDGLSVEGERIFLGRVDSPEHAFAKRLEGLIAKSASDEERRFLGDVKEAGMILLEEAAE